VVEKQNEASFYCFYAVAMIKPRWIEVRRQQETTVDITRDVLGMGRESLDIINNADSLQH
jgi:hypothetical protein